ncbi:ABC transporter permease [Fastidiosipila sanguinis]|uniref:ABC transporter permease n=1 Tax=Fastidiosipila sanguinis TaxID=236753 RepID=A0A2S0KPW4_9FIRM|nr:ABC transporter permease [Fastidiosipila sanguinis]AVM43080.1 ABC transporter permease [Fastidiosipila sanguinis]
MSIFKNYFKIVRKHKFSILLYTIIFLTLTLFFMNSDTSKDNTNYSEVRNNIYVEDRSNSKISKALVEYIDKKENIVSGLDKENLEDELFYRSTDAIVIIPEDFENTKEIIYKSSPQSMYSFLVKQRINEFIDKVYKYNDNGYEIEDSIKYANDDLDKSVNVQKINELNHDSGDESNSRFYFNFMSYPLLSQILLVVTLVMSSYYKDTLDMRHKVSVISEKKKNLILTLGHLVFGVVFWLLYIIICIVLVKDFEFNQAFSFATLNSFVFMVTAVTLSVLIGKLFQDPESLSVVINVLVLGSSFLSGVFVPQEIMGETTLKIARIFPNYYYVVNNSLIDEGKKLSDLMPNILIMLGFSIAFLILTNVIKKPITKNKN